MRRNTKIILFLVGGVLFTLVFCEFILYYIVAAQCSWPTPPSVNGESLKAFVLADIHMLGPYRGHWLDKWRREWQMHRAYQSILTVHRPDVVFILGDVFDEGEWANTNQFAHYVERFYKYFSVPPGVDLYIVAGNHDIGFHHNIRRGAVERFAKTFNSPSVQLITAKDNHFVLINSMALHGDSCNLCKEARRAIQNITDILQCSQEQCREKKNTIKYSRPIIMQGAVNKINWGSFEYMTLHSNLANNEFSGPMGSERLLKEWGALSLVEGAWSRHDWSSGGMLSDNVCTEPDAPPLPERNVPFRPRIDALSKEATEYLVHKLKPRVVFGGHTHHGCMVGHKYGNIAFEEHSVPSFSWRNRPDPKYLLISITPDSYKLNKCALPEEVAIAATAVVLLSVVIFTLKKYRRRLL